MTHALIGAPGAIYNVFLNVTRQAAETTFGETQDDNMLNRANTRMLL